MHTLFSNVGRSFFRAWVAAILILAPGVLYAPNLNRAVALGIAAVVASIAAGAKAIQVFVPQLTFASLLGQPYAAWLDSFTRAFLGAFITSLIGILNMPDLSTWKSLAVAATVGALAAGLRAIEGVLTPGETPRPQSGLKTPPPVVAKAKPDAAQPPVAN